MNFAFELHRLDKQWKRREFLGRQGALAASSVVLLLGGILSGWHVLLALALLAIQTGWIEALRFRKCGGYMQTRRSIWRGSTPHDARQRHLLYGWRPR